MEYLVVKWLHVLSSTFLFGTGVGSAFYMFFTSRTRDPHAVATVAKYVVIADWVFTTPELVVHRLRMVSPGVWSDHDGQEVVVSVR